MPNNHLLLQRYLPEQLQLQHLLDYGAAHLRSRVIDHVEINDMALPITVVELGSAAKNAPTIAFFGGVHGVERIGSQVLLSWLHSLIHRLQWDEQLQQRLQKVKLLFMPMVNPGGIWQRSRSNPDGVDLMRNAPVEGVGQTPFLLSGHRISPRLPWYRGKRDSAMAQETVALISVVTEQLLHSPFVLSVDCHSGFGKRDRLWCCYAREHQPMPHIAEVFRIKQLFEDTFPHRHPYLIEPQSVSYTTHGDLWDYLYLDHLDSQRPGLFLPFTLEMGSWLWLRKNPRQMFDLFGYFNPVISHRHQRVLRQHLPLFDFLTAITSNYRRWLPATESERQTLTQAAINQWFL